MQCYLKITAIQRHDGTEDSMEILTNGTFCKKPDGWKIKYIETDEEQNKTFVSVTAQKNIVSIDRKCKNIHSVLTVEKECRHNCAYQTPYGVLMIGIYGKEFICDINKNGGILKLCYSLDINSSFTGENEIKIELESKEET